MKLASFKAAGRTSYGAVTALVSPAIGATIDAYGYTPVTTVTAFTPLAACAVLWRAVK